MKKLFALLLALLLAATMCVGAMAETVSYVGTWVLTSIASAGMSFEPSTLGMDMTVVLNEDGSCIMSMMGMTEEGTWTAVEGGVAMTDASGATDTLTYRDGALVLASEGIEMILTPGVAAPAADDAAAADEGEYASILANLTLADFAGTWVLEHVECTYGWFTADDLGAGMTVVIEGDAAVITMTGADASETYNAVLELEEAEEVGTVMWASFVDENGEPDGSGMMFLLFDDGQLVWYEYDNAEEAEFYYCFDKIAE